MVTLADGVKSSIDQQESLRSARPLCRCVQCGIQLSILSHVSDLVSRDEAVAPTFDERSSRDMIFGFDTHQKLSDSC